MTPENKKIVVGVLAAGLAAAAIGVVLSGGNTCYVLTVDAPCITVQGLAADPVACNPDAGERVTTKIEVCTNGNSDGGVSSLLPQDAGVIIVGDAIKTQANPRRPDAGLTALKPSGCIVGQWKKSAKTWSGKLATSMCCEPSCQCQADGGCENIEPTFLAGTENERVFSALCRAIGDAGCQAAR